MTPQKLQKVKCLRAVSSVSKLPKGEHAFSGVTIGEWNIPATIDDKGNVTREAADIPYLGLKTASGTKGLPLTNIFFACTLADEGKTLGELLSDDYIEPNAELAGTLIVDKDANNNVSLTLKDVALAELV